MPLLDAFRPQIRLRVRSAPGPQAEVRPTSRSASPSMRPLPTTSISTRIPATTVDRDFQVDHDFLIIAGYASSSPNFVSACATTVFCRLGTREMLDKPVAGSAAGCRVNLGILIEVILFHGRKAVSHDDCRNATASLIRQVQPTTQRYAILSLELNVLAHDSLPELQPAAPVRSKNSRSGHGATLAVRRAANLDARARDVGSTSLPPLGSPAGGAGRRVALHLSRIERLAKDARPALIVDFSPSI